MTQQINQDTCKNLNIIISYIMHVLENTDKAIAYRIRFLNAFKRKEATTMRMLMFQHGIKNEEGLVEYAREAQNYILNIRQDLLTRMKEMKVGDLVNLLNNYKTTDKFIEKYKKKEEDLKNDYFFQRGKHLHRCVDRDG